VETLFKMNIPNLGMPGSGRGRVFAKTLCEAKTFILKGGE